jgi:pyruvate, water dikinase
MFETVPLARLLADAGHEYPVASLVFSVCEAGGFPRPVGFEWDPARDRAVATFDGLVTRTRFLERMRSMLKLLSERIGGPVDIEFASDGEALYLLQCRPQSYSDEDAPAEIPGDLPAERIVFRTRRFVSNGRVPNLSHVVFVDPHEYSRLPDLESLRAVGRAVGRLNQLLPKRQFMLIGPGRWGSRGDIRLGVSVTYSDISNTAMLVEVARRGGSVPEVSFGTHFFQDLVESSIRYLPLFPGEGGTVFNLGFLRDSPHVLAQLLPEYAHLAKVVRVIDVPAVAGGAVLRVLLNADIDLAVAFLASPGVRHARDRRVAGRGW